MMVPPLAFAALAGAFYIGLQREDPDQLPSAFEGRAAPAVEVSPLGTLPGFDDGSLRTGEVTLVNFWASWCPPCWREMPSMQRLKNEMDQSGFVILAVNVGEDEETVFGFTYALDEPIDIPLLLDLDGKVTDQCPIVGLPTSFVIDKTGRVMLKAVGGRLWDAPEFAGAIEQLLSEN